MKTIVLYPFTFNKGTEDAVTSFLTGLETDDIQIRRAIYGGATSDDDLLERVVEACPENVILIVLEDFSDQGHLVMNQMVQNGAMFEGKINASVTYCTLFIDSNDNWRVLAIEPEYLAMLLEDDNV